MTKDLLVLDSNLIRGKCLQYRLNRQARCDYARTPETAFDHIREKLRSGGKYDAIVLPAEQMRFAHGIASIYNTFGPASGGPRFVVMAGGRPREGAVAQGQFMGKVVEVSGAAEASNAAMRC